MLSLYVGCLETGCHARVLIQLLECREQLVSNGLLDNEPSESHNGTGQQQQTCKQAFCNACSEIPHGTVVLQPGDVIYIPRGWPHQVITSPQIVPAHLCPRSTDIAARCKK